MIIPDPADGKQRFLFQNVNIIAIGGSAAPQAGETTTPVNPGSNLITFAVPPLAAEKLVLAGGNAYLTLVAPDNEPIQVPAVGPEELFDGGLTPYDQ